MKFYVEGQKVHGLGYRAHLAMLALTSGVEKFYAENLTEQGVQKIAVYAGTDREKIDAFYRRAQRDIPEEAEVARFTEPSPYNSELVIPTVVEYVSTLTAGEITKGRHAITKLGEEAKKGFETLITLPSDITNSLVEKLPQKIAESLVDALRQAGVVKEARSD